MATPFLGGWVGTVDEEDRQRDKYAIAFAERYGDPEIYEPNPIALEKIKEKQHFDSGYLFTIVEEFVYGQDLEPGPQNIGNCVAYSHCLLLAAKVAHEVFVEEQPEQPLAHNTPVPYIPYSYGAGRVYIGGNRLRGDGSNCSWQIQASMEHGFLPCDSSSISGDVPQGSTTTGRLYGSSKSALDKLRPEAIQFDLVNSARVKDIESAKRIITETYNPIQICSDWGFTPQVYDEKYGIWIYRARGVWSHSMQLIGWIEIKGAEFIVVRNQWGRSAHKDCTPVIPKGSFIITPETLSRWLPNAYAATIGEIKGRPKRWVFPF